MTLLEALNPENKKKFRDLVKKFHPDTNKDPDALSKMQKLNSVKDSDRAFESFYKEVMGTSKTEDDDYERRKAKFNQEAEDLLRRHRETFKKRDEYEKAEKEKPKAKRPSIFKTDEEWHQWIQKVKEKRRKEQERVRQEQRS